ncbi:WG repeat-containing protein [Marivirga sp. S37H4]|uniref:WG repeat-containing protein n=1 Tax=Marivirga aurantiaca TaxID=2802615 RepID=A0A935CBG7_9BACT|nr:WG repeat-containing protein [Marivirga aurantiaca]MBK6265363.1 WG repeat-containing protein [Marivirga aurantiaca]
MKNRFFFVGIIMLLCVQSHAQQKSSWEAFWNADTTHIGFKDHNGEVKITPKFMGFTIARKFDDIIAVMEEKNGEYESYYLTKSGKTAAYGDLFISDNSADCESEGFIRFQDKETEHIGMLNSEGKVVVPAEYNALSRVRNGYIIALKNARKHFWEKRKHSGCNHYSWKGGKTYLIDTSNQIIIKKFKNENALDFYSLEKTAEVHPDQNRESYLAKDGQYYSFIDFKKTFQDWLFNNLINSLSMEKLSGASYKEIYYWKDNEGWVSQPKEKYLADHFDLLKKRLQETQKEGADYFISTEGLTIYDYESGEFSQFFNNCGQAKDWKYPLMTLVISHDTDDGDFYQDHISFLKTDEGYQLINVILRNTEE